MVAYPALRRGTIGKRPRRSTHTLTYSFQMNFLGLTGKTILVLGAANRKSVAWHVGRLLTEAGANVIHSVRTNQRRESIQKLAGLDSRVLVCDVERQEEIDRLRDEVAGLLGTSAGRDGESTPTLHGIVHSIAFADYSAGWLPFHETPRAAFLQAVDVSCFSLIAVANAFKDLIDPRSGSV